MEGVGSDRAQKAESRVGPLVEEAPRERLRETPEPAARGVLLAPHVVRGEGEGREAPQSAHPGRGHPVDGLLNDGRHDVRAEVQARRALTGALGEALREPEGGADEKRVHDPSLHQLPGVRTRGWTPEAFCSTTQSILEWKKSHDARKSIR